MPRHLSLSQAARLINVGRKDIQKKVLSNELIVMEGYVLLDDLKKAFPDAQYEDNSIMEKMQQFMDDAVHKMAESEQEGSQIDALSKRAYLLNQELSQQKAKANFYEQLINKLKHKFIDISTRQIDKTQIIKLQQWLIEETHEIQNTIHQSSTQLMEDQIQQFMQPHIRLLPSRHDFYSDKTETILESALHAGLGVDYGCSNGKCGKCKMKVISGKVEKIRHTDYVLSNEEKLNNTILSCSYQAISDVVLETSEAVSADDIALQTIETKIKSLDTNNDTISILNLKTPRSQRLRFLAGQEIKLSINSATQAESLQLSIASCPCDDMNIQFHIPNNNNSNFLQQLNSVNLKKTTITIEGPYGYFTLDEGSPRGLVFITEAMGFSAIKSLIEHALALDMAEHIHLYWIAKQEQSFYMKNLCRSWNDALDNFFFYPIISDADQNTSTYRVVDLVKENSRIEQMDYYISGSENMINSFTKELSGNGCKTEQLHTKEFCYE
ncbi:MAG: 2Fe-2S iron-sulfur cluster-binding protein [Pseudomonadota bacterium]